MSEEVEVKTPQEENQKLQGKKVTTKKKIRYYNQEDIKKELSRLERGGQQNSHYYIQLSNLNSA